MLNLEACPSTGGSPPLRGRAHLIVSRFLRSCARVAVVLRADSRPQESQRRLRLVSLLLSPEPGESSRDVWAWRFHEVSAGARLGGHGCGAARHELHLWEVTEEEDGMDLRFWVDPATSLPHIFDHGVSEDEVRQVLSRTAEDFPGTDGSRIRLGQTQAGRYLQVVYVPDSVGDGAFVVTAFDLTAKAKRAFRRRQRRKRT
jgi:hypothetical protein